MTLRLLDRRDEIDSSHYPVFHQMEGVRMFSDEDFDEAGLTTTEQKMKFVEDDLKNGLEGMVKELFGDVEMRWGEDYFPFTDPSYELEIYFNNEWLEVLGCGVVHKDIVKAVGRRDQPGWAFGLGLERLAMILFSIPDIRLFWTSDERFHSQFESGKIVSFQPYSKYPPCLKDISFWTSREGEQSTFHQNEMFEIVRDVAGDLVEKSWPMPINPLSAGDNLIFSDTDGVVAVTGSVQSLKFASGRELKFLSLEK